jgi:hypothetical protein
MAITISQLFTPTQLTTSDAMIYTCPTTPSTSVIKNMQIIVANTTGAAVTVRFSIVPVAGSASAANAFYYDKAIGANDYVRLDVPTMKAGDMLQGRASAATSITVSEAGGNIYST